MLEPVMGNELWIVRALLGALQEGKAVEVERSKPWPLAPATLTQEGLPRTFQWNNVGTVQLSLK